MRSHNVVVEPTDASADFSNPTGVGRRQYLDDDCAPTSVDLVEREVIVGSSTPSSAYEDAICRHLDELLATCKVTWAKAHSLHTLLLHDIIDGHTFAIGFTCCMLLCACIAYISTEVLFSSFLSFVVFALAGAMHSYLVWARKTESKYRTAAVIGEVLRRWKHRIEEMPTRSSLSPSERRRIVLESFARIPSKAFRMVAVVDDLTYRLKHIPKCLMISRSKRLDEATLVARIYKESVGLCKLMDVVREILQGDAIVLKPLIDRARPPRLPNLLMTNKKFVEEEATTDESDHERESRSALGGDNSISVSHHMEYFVHRVLLLSWVIAMVLLILSGMLHSVIDGTPIGIGVLLSPSIALLGLLPVNAMLLSRSLVLYANVYLDKLFHHIVAQRLHNVDDRLPRFSISSTLAMCIRILLRRQPSSGGKNPSLFSVSLVDGFGMATVIAMLDQKGIVTDMVLLPITILVLREDSLEESSSSERDDCHSIVGCLTERAEMEAEERQREMKRQIRRKKFHESRFLEMHLAPSSREELAVNFVSEKERRRNEGHINPVCLCILIHALAKEPTNLETWTEPFRFSDRSFLWARALHWIPRACGFDDRVAEQFVVLARIFQIDTKTKSGYRNTSPEQMCSLLARGPDDMLHVFTMGSPYMVSSFCTTHWTGTTVDEFETEEKKEVVFMGKHQWEEGMCLETVALSHRVLPERYRKYVQELPTKSTSYSEFFFRDGKEVNRKTWMERCQRREARREQQQRAARMNDGTDMAELALSPLYPSMAEGVKPRYDGAKPSSPPGTDEYEEFPLEKNPIAEWVSQSAPSSATTRTTKPKFKRNASFGDIPLATLGMFEADDCLTASTFIQLMATTSHTFLGLVGLRDSVRPSVQEAMSILDGAGVRCMYFCPDNERQTKSFGRRVGLETDWNCCISLKEDAVALDPHSIRAQLPFGIKSIRKHILHVDPIPLQVNLFSHAQGVSKRAMLSILQDNHEVVLAVGSVFNHANVRSFVQADLSIGVLPTRRGPIAAKENILRSSERVVEPSDFSNRTSANRDIPLYRNIAELIGCSCALRSPPTVSILPILATMVRQGRLRLSGIGNAIEFVLHANIFLVLMNSVVVLMGGPLLLSPSVTVLELNIFIPLLSLSCTYTAYSGIDPMKTMPSRHNYFVRLAIFRHSSVVWLLRYTPSLIAIIALGITALTHGCGTSIRALLTIHSDTCITAGRSYVLMTMNYWMLVHSWCHMSRHQPISLSFSLPLRHGRRSTFLFTSFRWLFVSLAVAALSVLLVLIRTPREGLRHAFFPSIPHFVVALLFPAVILVGDIAAKRWRERRFSNMQKYRKLTFGTRLGMHSPRGDYEPEGINYTNNFVDSTSPLNGGPSEEENTVTMHGSPTNIVVEAEPDITVTKRLNDWFYRYTSMLGGKLELNCVCCDHIGGNYATYHVSAKDM